MARGKFGKLDSPLKRTDDLSEQVNWRDYEHRKKFAYVCTVTPDEENEKLTITKQMAEDMKRSCVYVMVIDGKVFKIGTALRGMKNRIGSYNSGRIRYRTRGTNSGANYWILQSLLKMNAKAEFYAYYPPLESCTVFGEKLEEPFPSAKTVEGVVIRQFEARHQMKPIGCTQG